MVKYFAVSTVTSVRMLSYSTLTQPHNRFATRLFSYRWYVVRSHHHHHLYLFR